MNIDNGFDIIVAVVFDMITQLEVLGPKSQDLVILFWLGEGEYLPELHLQYLQPRREIYILINETGLKTPHL